MSRSQAVKAFKVQNEWGEGFCVAIFHTSNAAARRIGANELDCEWDEVSCRRWPGFDKYAPGPIPASAWIDEQGAWLSCSGPRCQERVHEETPPVYSEKLIDEAFCSEACRAKREPQVTRA